jgi:glyoxylase-like metal-dependent hydrolase (beta-lactamase superfamily II)
MMKVLEASLRAYNVGFGDCLLLKLKYDDESTRCVLFDFGSTKLPDSAKSNHMEVIANDIANQSRGKLAIVVATHRHADHISGFGDLGFPRNF